MTLTCDASSSPPINDDAAMAISHEPSIFPGLVRALSMDSAVGRDRYGARAEKTNVSCDALYILGALQSVPCCIAKYVSEERFAYVTPPADAVVTLARPWNQHSHQRTPSALNTTTTTGAPNGKLS